MWGRRRLLRNTRARRRAYLFVAGVGWLLYGVQVVQDPRPITVRSAAVLANLGPITAWGWAWVVGGAVAAVAAVLARPVLLWVGFSCAMFPPALWGIAYAGAYLSGSYPGAWTGAATWLGAALRLYIVGSWWEETPMPIPPDPEVARE